MKYRLTKKGGDKGDMGTPADHEKFKLDKHLHPPKSTPAGYGRFRMDKRRRGSL